MVDAGHTKLQFALEWRAPVVGNARVFIWKFDDGQDKVDRLVERAQDFVVRGGDGRRVGHPACYLDRSQFSAAGDPAFDVVAHFFRTPRRIGIDAAYRSVGLDSFEFHCSARSGVCSCAAAKK